LGRSFVFRLRRGMGLVFAHGQAYPPSMTPQVRYKGIPGEWRLYAAV
jgi:hypothetical protein